MISSFLRTVFLYLTLVFMIRLLGKRQLGELEPAEFVVTMMAANLATAPVEDPGSPMIYSLISILTVLGAELTITLVTVRSVRARRLLCGKPVILIENGHLLQENLRKTRLTLEELRGQLREKEIMDLTQVQYAILETAGGLSVFPRKASGGPPPLLPVTLVEEGTLLSENLERAGKTESWVRGLLRQRGAALEDTLLLTVDRAGHVVFLRKEEQP